MTVRYVTAVLFATNVLGFHVVAARFAKLLRLVERPVRWLAGTTFALYLFHLPIAQFLTTIVPWAPSDGRTRLVMLVGTFALVVCLAAVTESRKHMWRRAIGGGLRHASSLNALLVDR